MYLSFTKYTNKKIIARGSPLIAPGYKQETNKKTNYMTKLKLSGTNKIVKVTVTNHPGADKILTLQPNEKIDFARLINARLLLTKLSNIDEANLTPAQIRDFNIKLSKLNYQAQLLTVLYL